MSELKPPVGSQKEFIPPPAGPCMAVCADVYVKVDDNPFFGKTKLNGKPDNERTRTRVCIVFLTSHMMTNDNGQQVPMQVNSWHKFGWGTLDYPSNLRKFIKGWFPTATDVQVEAMDLKKIVGRGAYLIISHRVKEGKTYVDLAAAPPPPGAAIPTIPFDFFTYEQRTMVPTSAPAPAPAPAPAQQAAPPVQPPVPEPVQTAGDEDDLPF